MKRTRAVGGAVGWTSISLDQRRTGKGVSDLPGFGVYFVIIWEGMPALFCGIFCHCGGFRVRKVEENLLKLYG